MKKHSFRLAVFALALLLMLSLAGCSINLSDMIIVKRAYSHISQMDSLSFTADAQLDGSAGSLPLKLSAQADCKCVLDPATFQIQAQLDLGKLGKIELPFYIFSKDSAIHILTGLGHGDSTLWLNNSIPYIPRDEGSGQELTVDAVLDMLQSDPESLSVGESESINDVLCRPFTLHIPGQILMDAIQLEAEDSSDYSIDDMELTVWISVDEGMPVRASADMSSLLQYIIDIYDPTYLPKLKINSLPLTLDLAGYNDVGSITLPAV